MLESKAPIIPMFYQVTQDAGQRRKLCSSPTTGAAKIKQRRQTVFLFLYDAI